MSNQEEEYPECYNPEKDNPYPLCIGNRGSICEECCLYTGMKDKDGNRICENDIVKHEVSDTIGTVKWYQKDYIGWCVDDVVADEQQFTDEMWGECEVLGSIFDNPEPLKGGLR